MVSSQKTDLFAILQKGLQPHASKPRKVVIIGAGIAGLSAGYELQRAGHDVKILEATQRAGGRILTIREPFSDGLYGEAGAMRLPTSHKLTQTYIEKFGLQTMPFTKASANAFYYINGKKHLRHDIEKDPARLRLDALNKVPCRNQRDAHRGTVALDVGHLKHRPLGLSEGRSVGVEDAIAELLALAERLETHFGSAG